MEPVLDTVARHGSNIALINRWAGAGLSVDAPTVGGVVHALSTAPVPQSTKARWGRGGQPHAHTGRQAGKPPHEGTSPYSRTRCWGSPLPHVDTRGRRGNGRRTTEHRPFQTRPVRRVAHPLPTATLLIEGPSPWTKRGQPGRTSPLQNTPDRPRRRPARRGTQARVQVPGSAPQPRTHSPALSGARHPAGARRPAGAAPGGGSG